MAALFEDPDANPLTIFLMQVFITLVVCKIFAKLLALVRQPQVIGQIIAGIMFGPSVLGFAPNWSQAIWPASSLPVFQLVANLGLIFFMFFLGLELDLQQLKKSWRVTVPLALTSIIIPVGVGCAVALWLYTINGTDMPSPPKAAFILFIGCGIGFAAFPVLASLLNTMDLLQAPIGIQAISLAACEDIAVWIILAIASAFSSGGSALLGLYTLLLTVAFILIMFLIVRPILRLIHKYFMEKKKDETNVYLVVLCFLLLIVCAFTTEVMGIHAFFGSFIAGLCIPRKGELTDFLALRVELLVVEVFLPRKYEAKVLNEREGNEENKEKKEANEVSKSDHGIQLETAADESTMTDDGIFVILPFDVTLPSSPGFVRVASLTRRQFGDTSVYRLFGDGNPPYDTSTIHLDATGAQPNVIGGLVDLPVLPQTRRLYMTRF
ncbi:unnamed protein product [Didymodactylos carnosus]|uniref:Cation/H+ exchanger transmembrane domain-containing protein n=1 Tax=Didymodactylos carnosus TaxID=1234261 RepID=A0A814HSK7_9BILA|nr:unnamed protein product [Didymodactylos carnosus]CAF1014323.1 unnamed protein product [Didymodactylos carnosus]CAF3553726.1 unnamed protein product [Didymodactylos carnosus]CAF3785839.1 unnamed protein product [Didymodactylos carnosus]